MTGPGEPDTISVLLEPSLSADQRLDLLIPQVQRQLRAAAEQMLGHERPGHTLQATALVNEAYLRLVGEREIPWANREHFYKAASEAMRRILIDHARAKSRSKRGGERERADIQDLAQLAAAPPSDILRFDDVFRRLEAEDPSAAAVVRLRFFAGLSVQDTAAAMGISASTVDRRWAFARAWLYKHLSEPAEPSPSDGGSNDTHST